MEETGPAAAPELPQRTGSDYIAAILNDDRRVRSEIDKLARAIFVQTFSTGQARGFRGLGRIMSGQGPTTDAQDQAARNWADNLSLVHTVMVAHVLNFDTQHATCLPAKYSSLSKLAGQTTIVNATDVSTATHQFMRENPCNSDTAQRFERNLVRLYQENQAELEKWKDISDS